MFFQCTHGRFALRGEVPQCLQKKKDFHLFLRKSNCWDLGTSEGFPNLDIVRLFYIQNITTVH